MNQREIKFRMWRYCHKEGKSKFYYLAPSQIGVHDNDLVFSEGNINYCDDSLVSPQETIIQQFTGLQDRLGKDIYEGDIVKIEFQSLGIWDEDKLRWLEMVGCGGEVWHTLTKIVEVKYEISKNSVSLDFEKYCSSIVNKKESLTLEVIGNIMENQKLL